MICATWRRKGISRWPSAATNMSSPILNLVASSWSKRRTPAKTRSRKPKRKTGRGIQMKNNNPRHTMGKGLQQRASVNSGAYTMASIYARGQIARGYARRLGAARDAIAFTVALSVTLSSVGQWAYGMRLSTHQPELARRVFQQILCGLAE